MNLKGKIWSIPYETERRDMEVVMGLFQHFNYYDTEPVIDGSEAIPFKIGEAASLGGGAIIRLSGERTARGITQHLYANAVLLGGSLSDHYSVLERNYNLGSGFSLMSDTYLDLGERAALSIHLQHLQLYTWKGYSAESLISTNHLYLDAQGDPGSAHLTTLRLKLSVALLDGLTLGLDNQYYVRRTHYELHPDVLYRTFETRLGLYYTL